MDSDKLDATVYVVCEEDRLRSKNERLRRVGEWFVSLDWDGIIADSGGSPIPPDRFPDFDSFLRYARAALKGDH